MDIAKHVDELRKKIRRASELYYDKDSPEISDYEYDMMFEELKKLEREHPELDSADSPTHRVGGTASEKFEKVTHPVKMGSLSDVFSESELRDFLSKLTPPSQNTIFPPTTSSTRLSRKSTGFLSPLPIRTVNFPSVLLAEMVPSAKILPKISSLSRACPMIPIPTSTLPSEARSICRTPHSRS